MAADEDFSCSDDAFEADDRDEDSEMVHHSESHNEYPQHIVFYQNFDSVTDSSLQRPKTRRRRWTQRDMTNAYTAVKYQGMSLRGAATAFNVPESTLRDRVHGRVSLECSRPGPPTFFTFEEEKKMVDHILFMSKIGYPYTRNQVVELAGDMTKAVGRIAPFKYLNPSQAWFYAFLNRWPDLKNFLFGPRSTRKSKGVSGDSIQSYFEQLEKVLNKYGIKDKAQHFWIVDEVSLSCENQPPKILPITVQRSQSVSYWNPTVAMLGAANGVGEKIPPFLIFRGDTITTSMMEGSVRGTKFSSTPSGWVNSDAFIQWFLKHFRLLVALRPLVLFYDGHLQFVSVRVLERAREDGVFLFPLPPHPAFNHCVENTCFYAFESYFKKRLDRFLEQNPNQPLVRTNVAPVLTHAYEKALQPSNMIRLFEKLGICPFNNMSTSIGAYLNMPEEYDQFCNLNEIPEGFTALEGASSYMSYMSKIPRPISYLNASNLAVMNGEQSANSPVISPYANLARSTVAPMDDFQVVTGSKMSMSHSRIPTTVLSSNADNQIKSESTNPTATQVPNSGRTLTIRLHGPAANALHPLARSGADIQSKTFGLNVKPVTTRTSQDSCNSDEPESVAHVDVDIAYEEEIGYDSIPSQYYARSGQENYFGHSSLTNGNTGATLEEMNEIEDSEAPDSCVVCGQLEPPELSCQPDSGNLNDPQVVDWAHCDYCNRWVHLNSCCSEGALIGNNSFMCVVCREAGALHLPLPTSTISP